jgi:hypothetical protein
MSGQFSFDIVSKIDLQELDNAVNQANKEINQRYDFKGSISRIERNENQLVLHSEDDFKLKAVIDILQSKLVKRGIGLKSLGYGKVEPAAKGTVRQNIELKQGIDKENSKKINTMIKNAKLKVSSVIQGEQLRISGKSKDDLQEVMQMVKALELDIEVQFMNYR